MLTKLAYRSLVVAGVALAAGRVDAAPLRDTPVRAEPKLIVSAAGRKFNVSVMRVRLDQVRVRVGLAGGRVGRTQDLAGIAEDHKAEAAINGSFFNAYESGPIKNPGHLVIVGGEDRFVGSIGTIIGFTADGEVRMERSKEVIAQRGSWGVKPVLREGEDFWSRVEEGLGCGPRLLKDGKVCLNAAAEGFSSPKVLTASAARSAVGITTDGWLLFVTTDATMRQLADVMKALQATQAMNLDGGASSGLWVRGKYLRRPGRPVSNALLVLKR